jgi:hypothetical protein
MDRMKTCVESLKEQLLPAESALVEIMTRCGGGAFRLTAPYLHQQANVSN